MPNAKGELSLFSDEFPVVERSYPPVVKRFWSEKCQTRRESCRFVFRRTFSCREFLALADLSAPFGSEKCQTRSGNHHKCSGKIPLAGRSQQELMNPRSMGQQNARRVGRAGAVFLTDTKRNPCFSRAVFCPRAAWMFSSLLFPLDSPAPLGCLLS